MQKVQAIPFGAPILYFNQWTRFECKEISECFRRATTNDLMDIQGGGIIWIDQDPIHTNGKVYGYVPRKILAVTQTPDGHVRVTFQNGESNIRPGESLYPMFVLEKPERLVELLEKHPEALEVISGESEKLWELISRLPSEKLIQLVQAARE